MINLAGDKKCDKTIENELNIAGIPIIKLPREMNTEVPASVIGYLNEFRFYRAWYYWVVDGYMPLQYAKELYTKYKDLYIRVAGDCGNPSPEKYSEPKDFHKKCKAYTDKVFNKEMSFEEADAIYRQIKKQGDQFITTYHIDTQEGLLRFAEIIKKYNIIG